MHIVLPSFRYSVPSPDLPFRAYNEHVKIGCASRHVELRANQAIPPAEEAVINYTFANLSCKIIERQDDITVKVTIPLVLQGVVASSTLLG